MSGRYFPSESASENRLNPGGGGNKPGNKDDKTGAYDAERGALTADADTEAVEPVATADVRIGVLMFFARDSITGAVDKRSEPDVD